MASGEDHDKATCFWSLPFGFALSFVMGLPSGLIGGLAFVVGGLWLSPDLDTYSKPLKRWGLLQGLWWPYRKLIPHRSLFSHGPLIGTGLRLAYLMSWTGLLLMLLQPLGCPAPLSLAKALNEQLRLNPQPILAVLLGLEASVWLHLILDGDPLPAEWHRWRHR